MKPLTGIIADDFTGALMVACYLESAGIFCPVVFDVQKVQQDASVVVAGTRIRTVPARDAVSEIRSFADAFLSNGFTNIVYKPSAGFDSSPEGNIGQAADCLAERVGVRPVLMAAGFPAYQITTHQGCLFYRGKLVTESIKRFDPLTPMSDPDLVRFLSLQTRRRVGLVNHLTIQKGASAIRDAACSLELDDVGHIFFDVSDDSDICAVVRYAAGSGKVFVASDPVAVAYAKLIVGEQPGHKPLLPRHAKGPAAVLVGTVGPVIQKQMQTFAQVFPKLDVDLANTAEIEVIAERAIYWALQHFGQRPFAITTSGDALSVEKTQEIFGRIGAARRAEGFQALLARRLHDLGARRFVVAGGETSGAVVTALGLKAVRALPDGPLGTGFCVSDGPDPVSLFLKPGKHGADDIILRALEAMS